MLNIWGCRLSYDFVYDFAPDPSQISLFLTMFFLCWYCLPISAMGRGKIRLVFAKVCFGFQMQRRFQNTGKWKFEQERKVTVSMTGSSPLFFHFDTHIITQMNREVGLTFFDKVSSPWISNEKLHSETSYCTSPRDFSMYNVDFYPKLHSQTFLFGTDSDQNGMLEEIPRSGTDSYRWLSHLGVRALGYNDFNNLVMQTLWWLHN
jgi:hypothetical protein